MKHLIIAALMVAFFVNTEAQAQTPFSPSLGTPTTLYNHFLNLNTGVQTATVFFDWADLPPRSRFLSKTSGKLIQVFLFQALVHGDCGLPDPSHLGHRLTLTIDVSFHHTPVVGTGKARSS